MAEKWLVAANAILSTLLCLCSQTTSMPAAGAGISNASKRIQGSVTENELIDNLERVGIKCLYHQGENAAKGYLTVDTVRMGSTAYYKGIENGDKIKSVGVSNDFLTIQIERNGQPFQVQLRALTPTAASTVPLRAAAQQTANSPLIPVASVNQPKIPLVKVDESTAPLVDVSEKAKEKKLVKYNIELIIDITGSMLEHDGTGALTKFQWCHEQVRDFAKLMAEYRKTLTITTFNTSFKTEYDCDVSRVEQIYNTITPEGNTCLVNPLVDRLEYAFHHHEPGKATIIAVITDGMPNVPRDPHVVNRALIDFTRQLTDPNEVIVTFLQIGDTFNGKSFCIDLDDNLVNEGAKYDIIDTKTFDELKDEGLTQALIDAVTEKRSVRRDHSTRGMSAEDKSRLKDADAKLHEKMDERKALEKLLNFTKPVQP
ncbi:MAG TPA: hypothetical protein V6C89_05510 [Drouetiella sp.]